MPIVTDFTAILPIYDYASWTGSLGASRPVIITYSIEQIAPVYLAENGYSEAAIASVVAFGAPEIAAIHRAIEQWGEASGITFLEVGSGHGDIRLTAIDTELAGHPASGYGESPRTFIDELTGEVSRPRLGGDVFVDRSLVGISTDLDYLFLHEIGHALGLSHPFDGLNRLPPSLDTRSNTVMSYGGEFMSSQRLGYLDIQAIQHLFGPNSGDGSQVSSWSWNQVDERLVQRGTENSDKILGCAVSDVITGYAGADTLAGFDGTDRMYGGLGNDNLSGNEGNDSLYGDSGDDRLFGGTGVSNLYGGSGSDTLVASSIVGELIGGTGIDTLDLTAMVGDVTLYMATSTKRSSFQHLFLGAGDDLCVGTTSNNILTGGLGSDSLYGSVGRDSLTGDDGNDSIFGGVGDDQLGGSSGVDRLFGGEGNDFIGDAEGNDKLFGNAGLDTLYGGNDGDRLYGGLGDDQLSGDNGNDTIFGGGEYDVVIGGLGDDYLYGGTGGDGLYGYEGRDVIYGGDGIDYIYGGQNNDTIDGGRGDDVLGGEQGADVFVFAAGGGNDIIRSFLNGADRIDLIGISYDEIRKVGQNGGVHLMVERLPGVELFLGGVSVSQITSADFL
jgi:Ca2+-binding RTX toxin-like protein